MIKNEENLARTNPVPTDVEIESAVERLARTNPVPTNVEIESAVERLGPNWTRVIPRPRTGGASQIFQNLAHGRSHAVVVEIKRSHRRTAPGP